MNIYILMTHYGRSIESVYEEYEDAFKMAKNFCSKFNYNLYRNINKNDSFVPVCDFCSIEKHEVINQVD